MFQSCIPCSRESFILLLDYAYLRTVCIALQDGKGLIGRAVIHYCNENAERCALRQYGIYNMILHYKPVQ